MPKVVVSAGVEPAQREALVLIARQNDRPLSYVVREALSAYLERDPPPKPMARAVSSHEEAARP